MTRPLVSSPLLALALAGLLLIGPATLAWAADPGAKESQRIKAAEKKERRLLDELNGLEKRISLLEDRIARTERDISLVWKRLAQGEKEIKALGRRLTRLKKYLRRRLRAMYLLRGGGLLQVLLKAESIPNLAHRYRYISAVLERDKAALREYNDRQARLKAWTKQLKADRAGLYRLKVDLGSEKKKLVKARHAKTAVLMKVHQRKELYLAMLRSRAESRRGLIREVFIRPESDGRAGPGSQAETPDRKWPDFGGLKGRIPRPVPGGITGSFGQTPGPFDTYTTRHGVVFETKAGTSVKTVLDGRVIFTGWLKGYGNIIIINHGHRYYTLTGGLSGLRHGAGQWVSRGEILGVTPKGSHFKKKDIYFEIRHRGRALNPSLWLGDKPAGQVTTRER